MTLPHFFRSRHFGIVATVLLLHALALWGLQSGLLQRVADIAEELVVPVSVMLQPPPVAKPAPLQPPVARPVLRADPPARSPAAPTPPTPALPAPALAAIADTSPAPAAPTTPAARYRNWCWWPKTTRSTP